MIKVYDQEKQIEHQILSNNTIAYCAKIAPTSDNKSAATINEFIRGNYQSYDSPDLFPYVSLLVSSVWNNNDDVFSKEALWAARKTPKNHPCNIDHNQKDIVGHITDILAVDANYNIIPDDKPEAELPELIHLINYSVLYTQWQDEDQETRVEQLIAEILAGKKYVSMEATFYEFDYAIRDITSGEMSTIVRNEETSFLSKHLRAYGGEGIYGNYQLGRQPKKLIFIGKGIVSKPANPYSVIFNTSEVKPFCCTASLNFQKIFEDLGVQSIDQTKTENVLMSQELETKISELEAQLQAIAAEKQLLATERDALASEKDSLVAQVTEYTEKVNTLEASLGLQVTELDSAKTQNSELVSSQTALASEVETLKNTIAAKDIEFITYKRRNELAQLGVANEEADSLIKNFGTASNENWLLIAKLATKNTKVLQTMSAGLETEPVNNTAVPLVQELVTDPDTELRQAIAAALKE